MWFPLSKNHYFTTTIKKKNVAHITCFFTIAFIQLHSRG